MFTNDPSQLRTFYISAWQKFNNQEPLSPLEKQVSQVIYEHPEYHNFFNNLDNNLDINLDKYNNQSEHTNPFLHLGLHLGVRDQIALDNPKGIQNIYNTLINKSCNQQNINNSIIYHEIEHSIMEILMDELMLSQKYKKDFDTTTYLNKLNQLLFK